MYTNRQDDAQARELKVLFPVLCLHAAIKHHFLLWCKCLPCQLFVSNESYSAKNKEI